MDRWIQEVLDDLYSKMTPEQRAAFEQGLREHIAQFDAWGKTPKARKVSKPKAAKKR